MNRGNITPQPQLAPSYNASPATFVPALSGGASPVLAGALVAAMGAPYAAVILPAPVPSPAIWTAMMGA